MKVVGRFIALNAIASKAIRKSSTPWGSPPYTRTMSLKKFGTIDIAEHSDKPNQNILTKNE